MTTMPNTKTVDAAGDLPEAALLAMLSDGPMQSNEAKARMAQLGFTAKQIRAGRERAGLLVTRAGSGATMHTTWELAEPGKDRAMAFEVCHVGEVGEDKGPTEVAKLAGISVGTNGSTPSCASGGVLQTRRWAAGNGAAAVAQAFVPTLTLDEKSRVDRRVDHFVHHRGVDQDVARTAAVMLVVRDRARATSGSCIECQAYTVPTLCRTVGPKAIGVVWQCASMRRDGP